MSGFRKFLLRGNLIDLAVAFVIGAAFATLIQALVKGFVTPLIGLAGGLPDFSQYVLEVGAGRFLVGEFVNALLSFLVIAGVLYFFIVAVASPPAAPQPPRCAAFSASPPPLPRTLPAV